MPTVTSVSRKEEPRVREAARRHVWTPTVRALGNLIPILFALPPALYGVWWMATRGESVGKGLWFFAASPVIGWLAMNFLGLYRNGSMKSELRSFLMRSRQRVSVPPVFVGVATPKYRSLVDPHEDVGFLILHPDRIEFFGDTLNLSIQKNDISAIGSKMNPHSLVGLGRWVVVDGRISGQKVRLKIEPREKRTLLGNFLYSRKLKTDLIRWLNTK